MARNLTTRLNRRREELGMSFAALSARSGVSEGTAKRTLNAKSPSPSLPVIDALANALGVSLDLKEDVSPGALREQVATEKAEHLVRLTQGTSALESQAVSDGHLNDMVRQTMAELMAGPNRRLWAS